jgi:hypothetical protein
MRATSHNDCEDKADCSRQGLRSAANSGRRVAGIMCCALIQVAIDRFAGRRLTATDPSTAGTTPSVGKAKLAGVVLPKREQLTRGIGAHVFDQAARPRPVVRWACRERAEGRGSARDCESIWATVSH